MIGDTTGHEANSLTRLLAPIGECMTREIAEQVVDLRADSDVQARVGELADKCTEGELTAEERAEYESYVHAIRVIGVRQVQARSLLHRYDASNGQKTTSARSAASLVIGVNTSACGRNTSPSSGFISTIFGLKSIDSFSRVHTLNIHPILSVQLSL